MHRNNCVTSAISRPSTMGPIGGSNEFCLGLARPQRGGEVDLHRERGLLSHHMEETRMALQVWELARRQAQDSRRVFREW